MPATVSPARAIRWRGPQPVCGQAESDFSSAAKNACETNGLYGDVKLQHESSRKSVEGLLSWPLTGARPGLAQASHSSAGIWLTDATASREISEDVIDRLNWSTPGGQSSRTVTLDKDRALQSRLQGRRQIRPAAA